MISLKQTIHGQINLQVLRIGESYKKQKSEIFFKEWTNIFFSPLPQPPVCDYEYYDIRQGMPFDDNTFDAVYALRIIEHLSFKEGQNFAREVHRVLKPGGLCRFTAPDLEDIVREYLRQMESCLSNKTPENILKYHWSMLELYDQMVREQSGGQMLEAVRQEHYDRPYCKERYGDVFEEFLPKNSGDPTKEDQRKNILERIKRVTPKSVILKIIRIIKSKIYWKRMGNVSKKLEGDPRKTMEANRWMYDQLSLRLLLEEAGFKEGKVKNYKESDIPDWQRFNFDQSNSGDHPIEPSLYFEARKMS